MFTFQFHCKTKAHLHLEFRDTCNLIFL